MSRSVRKTPISGRTKASSDKEFKTLTNRTLRRAIKAKVHKLDDSENIVFPIPNEISNVWDSNKDGKGWIGLDKNHPLYKKLMRK